MPASLCNEISGKNYGDCKHERFNTETLSLILISNTETVVSTLGTQLTPWWGLRLQPWYPHTDVRYIWPYIHVHGHYTSPVEHLLSW